MQPTNKPTMTRLSQRARLAAAIAMAAAAGCGNYSSEDIEYQLALPEQEDLSVKLPTQQMLVADSAEYYVQTRKVVGHFNGLMDGLLGLIDFVRALPPSERKVGQRVWGPFTEQKDRRWEVGMAMTKVADARVPMYGHRFDYAVQFRLKGTDASSWQPIITGTFSPSGGVRQGTGRLVLDLARARALGFPVNEFDALSRLTIDYANMTFPVSVTMRVWNVGSPEEKPDAVYDYFENRDGSGEMRFGYRPPELNGLMIQITSRWIGSGAGQAEAHAVGATTSLLGRDCWGLDTVATFVMRTYQGRANKGEASSCIFGAP